MYSLSLIMRLFFLVIFYLFVFSLIAQPEPCVDPPTMTSFCNDACIICDIDGFTGRHNANIVGQAPPGFAGECTFVAHNMQWIAFIAGSTNLSVNMAVSNCDQDFGLEFGLYEGIDCQNFRRISNCFGGAAGIINEGQSGTIINSEPLVIGQYYYIVMDGGFGDNCDWTFTVLSGSTSVLPIEESGEILGPEIACPDFPLTYSVDAPVGATEYYWTLDGVAIGDSSQTTEIVFPSAGSYSLCVTSANRCDEGPPSCRDILVETVPPTNLGEIVCEGECLAIADTLVCETGLYIFTLQNQAGCDSIVTLNLIEQPTPVSNLNLSLCVEDTFFIGNLPFTETGNYQETLPSFQDCDSIINLDLQMIICNIQSETEIQPVDCFAENTGQLDFMVTNGTPPFTYSWEQLDGVVTGTGFIDFLNLNTSLTDLASGTYSITIEDDFGNFNFIVKRVLQPERLTIDLIPVDQNGFGVSCPEATDGSITANVMGGNGRYNYAWNNGRTDSTIDQLSPGDYAVLVTDNKGCTITESLTLDAPIPVVIEAEFLGPDCSGPTSGIIDITQTSGGTGVYQYVLNGNSLTTEMQFTNLSAGSYEVLATDENGCSATTTGTLIAAEIPMVDLGESQTINLGTVLELNPSINDIQIDTFQWTTSTEFDCEVCLNPSTVPLNDSFYQLEVVSADGCSRKDSVAVSVIKRREFYVPNAFSPNADGRNDFFTIYGGVEVESIVSLTIFNRWGGVFYEGNNLIPSNELQGWNGQVKGEDAEQGVYVWMARIRFIDGVVIDYGGDISLLR